GGHGTPTFYEAPNFSLQAPEKHQSTSPNKATARGGMVFEIWKLGLLWSLEVGAWSFLIPLAWRLVPALALRAAAQAQPPTADLTRVRATRRHRAGPARADSGAGQDQQS